MGNPQAIGMVMGLYGTVAIGSADDGRRTTIDGEPHAGTGGAGSKRWNHG